ncbi:MAG: hypothetical protein DCC49_04495 [Acidobacteria bacterium]|nr:MAG: hypothetical protein DCC49_04495 [Acidobacteriota bacterium]
MLDMNSLVPEILIGVGAAIFVGSLLALLRQRTPTGLLTKHPSHRPRAVADEQLPVPTESAKESKPSQSTEHERTAVGTESSEQETSNADVTSADNDSEITQTFRLRRARTIFFMIAGFVATVWGIATILARG